MKSVMQVFKKLIDPGNILIIAIIGSIILGTWLYMSYMAPLEIHYKYSGLKYKNGDPSVVVPITIDIDGSYTRGLFNKEDEFKGKIIIADKELNCEKKPIKFNKYKMASLDSGTISNSEHFGMIYIGDMFKRLTIDIHELGENQVYYPSGWLISAPCEKRDQAVEISNSLVQRMSKGLLIK